MISSFLLSWKLLHIICVLALILNDGRVYSDVHSEPSLSHDENGHRSLKSRNDKPKMHWLNILLGHQNLKSLESPALKDKQLALKYGELDIESAMVPWSPTLSSTLNVRERQTLSSARTDGRGAIQVEDQSLRLDLS
jgi:hypothetical protein